MRPSLVRATLAGRKTQTRRLVTPGTSTVIGWKSASAVWPRLLLAEATTIVMRPPEGQDYQALRRAFRYGQRRTVHCYYVVTPFERAMRIRDLRQRKAVGNRDLQRALTHRREQALHVERVVHGPRLFDSE